MPNFDLMSYLNLHNGTGVRTMFGDWRTGMGRGDTLYIDYVLSQYTHLTDVVELGTMCGLTTCYLGVATALRGGRVYSYDIVDLVPPEVRKAASGLPIEYRIGSCLNPGVASEEIKSLVNNGHTLLFCDNGNKEREIEIYASYVGSGSVLIAHDWGTEVFEQNIAPFLRGFETVDHDVAEKMSSHLRAWRRL